MAALDAGQAAGGDKRGQTVRGDADRQEGRRRLAAQRRRAPAAGRRQSRAAQRASTPRRDERAAIQSSLNRNLAAMFTCSNEPYRRTGGREDGEVSCRSTVVSTARAPAASGRWNERTGTRSRTRVDRAALAISSRPLIRAARRAARAASTLAKAGDPLFLPSSCECFSDK